MDGSVDKVLKSLGSSLVYTENAFSANEKTLLGQHTTWVQNSRQYSTWMKA
jgi:hypothetical protein